jgi:hypothetical protein
MFDFLLLGVVIFGLLAGSELKNSIKRALILVLLMQYLVIISLNHTYKDEALWSFTISVMAVVYFVQIGLLSVYLSWRFISSK